MATLLVSHPASLGHDTGPGHPECADRIRVIEQVLAGESFRSLMRREAPPAEAEVIRRVHPLDHVRAIEAAVPAEGSVYLDADTVLSAGTLVAALHAVGGATAAVDSVMGGDAENAFVAVRPPGHHAGRTSPMGFCIFNNAAIATCHARAKHGAERVAIVDFDVHHGNGTQSIFWSDPHVLYCSTHQMPLFPGTGARRERGEHDTIVNAPLTAGSDGAVFRDAITSAILPRLNTFAPDLIIISAGFDAHRRDPLANLNLTEMDFAWVTGKIADVAASHCDGRIISILEGGYDLEGLSGSVAAHVQTLMGSSLSRR